MPLELLRVGHGVYVPTREITLLQEFPSRPARRDKQAAQSAGLWKDAASLTGGSRRRDPVRTLVHLRSGLVVGSPYAVETLANRSPIAAPVRASTRRNAIEAAQVVSAEADATPELSPIPIERAQVPPDSAVEENADSPEPRAGRKWLPRLRRA